MTMPHPDRYDARGNVLCNNCRLHLHPDSFKPWPGKLARPGKLWPYCKNCTRLMDRQRRSANVSTPEGRAKENRESVKRHRRLKRAEYAERRETAANAIAVLNKRGLTNSDIAVILNLSRPNISKWKQQKVARITSASVERLLALVVATRDWPLSETPAFHRRLPHPRREELRQRLQPAVLRFRVRNPWLNRKQEAA